MSSSLTKKTMGGFLWLGGVKAANVIFQFAILAILARLLNPSEFGLIGLALIVISLSEIFNDMGFGPAVTQKKDLSQIDYSTAFYGSIMFGLIVVAVVQLSAHQLALFFRNADLEEVLRVISIVILLNGIKAVPLGYMYREMQFKLLSLIQISSYVLGYGLVGVILAYLGYGVWALVYAVIAHTLMSLLLYFFLSKKKPSFGISWGSFKSLLHFGGGYSLSKVFSFAANKGDRILVGRVLGVDSLGHYERGFRIVRHASGLFGEIIDKVLFSPLARKQDERKRVGEIYLELSYLLAIIFFPFSGFVAVNAEAIVNILLGSQWQQTVQLVQILSISIFFSICTRIGSTVAKSLGDVYRRAWRTLFYAIYILVSVYFSSQYWGVTGATYAVAFGSLINYALAFWQVNQLTKVRVVHFFSSHGLGLILLLIYVLLMKLVTLFISELNSLVQLFLGGVVLLMVYGISFVLDRKKVFSKYVQQALNVVSRKK